MVRALASETEGPRFNSRSKLFKIYLIELCIQNNNSNNNNSHHLEGWLWRFSQKHDTALISQNKKQKTHIKSVFQNTAAPSYPNSSKSILYASFNASSCSDESCE